VPNSYYDATNYKTRLSIGYLLRHSSKLITLHIESLFVGTSISFVQYVMLMNIRDGLCTTAAELCHLIGHDSGAIARLIEQMEKQDMLKRERSESDRRTVELSLTEQGRQIADSFIPKVAALYNELLEDFTPEETNMLISLLSRFDQKLVQKKDKSGCGL